MNFVPCVTWIKRGVAKSVPDKVQLTKEELQLLIQEARSDLKDIVDDENDENEEESTEKTATVDVEIEEPEDIDAKYNLDDYDNEENANYGMSSLAQFTHFASNDEDPNITVKDEDDDSEDEEDFNIKATDNLIAIGKVEEDYSSMEVHVYNEEGALYVHHDIVLPAYPLAMEWMDYDPTDRKGNFLAIGDMTPVIQVWDLDIVDTLEPVAKLGSKKKKDKKKKGPGHKDAVLSLSWNQNARHILASGSVDKTVILWDLSESKPVKTLQHHTEKVQSIKWHPCEAEMLLTGGCDGVINLCDCRTTDEKKTWNVEGEVEKVLWNHFDPYYYLVGTDMGFVVGFDVRSDKSVFTLKAHDKAVSDLALSSSCEGCLVTVSSDKSVKIWDIANNQPSMVLETTPGLGDLFAVSPCPDCPFVFAVGGDNRADNFKVWDIRTSKSVRNRFLSRTSLGPSNEDDEEDETFMETEATTSGLEKLTLDANTMSEDEETQASNVKLTKVKKGKKTKTKSFLKRK